MNHARFDRIPYTRAAADVGPGQLNNDDAAPLVLVVEPSVDPSVPTLAGALQELCGFLRVRLAHVAVPEALPEALALHRPIGVLACAGANDQDIVSVVNCVAAFDPSLPVLLITQPTATAEAVEPAPRHMPNLYWTPAMPPIRDVVDFLFLAERQAGQGGLMPI